MQSRNFGKYLLKTVIFLLFWTAVEAQPISGVWKGKMGSSRVELKLVRKDDSLIGTSYYYDSKSSYRRYSIKGYYDGQTNDVVWWDDQLIEDNGGRHFSGNGFGALLAVADFNCPGEGIMKLDGKSSRKNDDKKDKKELHLVKGNSAPVFPDEWDFLIENYAYGVSHPEIVDSIEQMAFNQGNEVPTEAGQRPVANPESSTMTEEPTAKSQKSAVVVEKPVPVHQQVNAPIFLPPALQTNEERFTSRTKI